MADQEFADRMRIGEVTEDISVSPCRDFNVFVDALGQ